MRGDERVKQRHRRYPPNRGQIHGSQVLHLPQLPREYNLHPSERDPSHHGDDPLDPRRPRGRIRLSRVPARHGADHWLPRWVEFLPPASPGKW